VNRWRQIYRAPGAIALVAALAALVLITIFGVIALWPSGDTESTVPALNTVSAEVVAVSSECRAVLPEDSDNCLRVTVIIEEGGRAGEESSFDLAAAAFDVDVGDSVRVTPSGAPADLPDVDQFQFVDFERQSPLIWLAIAFALLVIVTARLKGLRALGGLLLSVAVVIGFIVPAIVDGNEPVAVAFIGALAIMLGTIPLTHGLGPHAVAACVGTATALAITLGIAVFAVDAAHITGFGAEEATLLAASADVDLQGLLIAGIVIATLGVLDDLTVSQASTVMALRAANPSLGGRELFRRGLGVGHDHIAATVNTLVLAYVGASLPTLIVFSLGDTSLVDAATSEVVAAPIVATLVGSIGLILAAPLTTATAAYLATQVPEDALDAAPHAH
jgi:uncharacterized membrane protein